jgi:hypothetical protein
MTVVQKFFVNIGSYEKGAYHCTTLLLQRTGDIMITEEMVEEEQPIEEMADPSEAGWEDAHHRRGGRGCCK